MVCRMRIGMAVRFMSGMLVMVGMAAVTVGVARVRWTAGEAGMRADERDQSRNDEAEQRQKDDRLVHQGQPFIRLISSTAIEPRLR